uniref:Calpain 9 n=1 Tax=Poecilia reticulata TaxID=8081 RepID=A0A3P9QDU4_POERE
MFLLSCQHACVLLQAKPSETDLKGVALYLEDKPVSVCLGCDHQPVLPSQHSSLHPPLCHLQLTSHLLLLFLLRALKKRMPLQSTLSGRNSNQAVSSQWDGKSFEQLRQECLQKGVLFEDPDFPATDASLFFSQSVPVQIEWKRPREICKNPKFIVGGADRTDICQGQLGDCWLLAAIASLTLKKEALARVVPHDQDFDSGYAGIFHFQFWQHNKWLDVVVDDRLPSVRNRLIMLHSASNDEFWSALLEKAYAKVNGSYESLKGGSTMEAMEDFTGGVGEMYETKSAPDDLFTIMKKALDRGSMMGCSIDITSSAESEAKTSTGLVKGHAYSITGLEEVNFRGQKVKLIRIRNPWGQVEWNGRWSDNAREWDYVDKAEKTRILQNSTDDGEFWMEFEDFKRNYDKVEICNMSPDALEDDTKRHWEVNVFEGNWIRGSTAGGCRNYIDTFWTNPQFKLQLEDADDDDDVCSVVIALMQKNRRKLRKEGLDLETIGFAVYEAPDEEDQVGKDFFRYHPSKARSRTYINMREVSERFTLPPGKYLLVPTTFQPHQEADFLIRIFSEKKAEAIEMGTNVDADLPEPPLPSAPEDETEEEKGLRRLFEQLAGSDKAICVNELQEMLNGVLSRRREIKFDGVSLSTCHSIINLMDVDNTGKMEFQEFKVFWDKMKKWIMLFLSFDTDRSGKMSSYELRTALKAAGMNLNNQLLQLIGLRFADDNYDIDFDDYLTCIVRLENMFRVFQALDEHNRGRVRMNMMQFLLLSMNV